MTRHRPLHTIGKYHDLLPSSIARGIAEFIEHYTQPVTDDDINKSPNTECPICLEPPTSTHGCVKITNIPGCTHLIVRECLEGRLTHSAQRRKACYPGTVPLRLEDARYLLSVYFGKRHLRAETACISGYYSCS